MERQTGIDSDQEVGTNGKPNTQAADLDIMGDVSLAWGCTTSADSGF